jgi:lipoprotein NlpD
MRIASVAFIVALMAVFATGCASTVAPVVDRPVWDTVGSPAPAPLPAPAVVPSSSPVPPPAAAPGTDAAAPDWRPDLYTVQRGDTLYSIALDHGLAYRDLAAWNDLTDPNMLRLEQQVKLKPPPGWVERPDAGPPEVIARALPSAPPVEVQALEPPAPVAVKSAPKAVKVAYSDEALAKLRGEPPKAASPAAQAAPAPPVVSPGTKPPVPAPAAKPVVEAGTPPPAALAKPAPATPGAIAWVWPARGTLLHGFNEGANPKGVAIGGELGQAIIASAAGKVVYSGSGLRGYGKLVIIKHDSAYLSVYAHNRALLVKEGERVTKGQKIAEMGNTDAGRVALHFEIRRLGKPVDPLQYLPGQGAS